MRIFYRISKYLSSNPNPLGKNKEYINKECLFSFLAAFGHMEHEITFIVDSLDPEWVTKHLEPYGKIVYEHGKVETLYKAYDIVCESIHDNENVLLCEDDYMWRPDAGIITRAVDELSLVSPYDHPGHYTEERFKFEPKQMRLVDGHIYRSAPSNTHTFACKAWYIKQNIDLCKQYGLRDHEMFQSIGVQLWVSVPSLATHLVTGLIAPGFDLKTLLS